MYILYESYDDSCKNLIELELNTKIVSAYNSEENGVLAFDKLVEDTITETGNNTDWFKQDVDTSTLDNKNIIRVCEMYNGGLDEFSEFYTVILEKVEVEDNDR